MSRRGAGGSLFQAKALQCAYRAMHVFGERILFGGRGAVHAQGLRVVLGRLCSLGVFVAVRCGVCGSGDTLRAALIVFIGGCAYLHWRKQGGRRA